MLHIGRARHPGPGFKIFSAGQLSVEFVNVRLEPGVGFLCSVPGGG